MSLGVNMDAEPVALPIGKGEVLREGTDVAIISRSASPSGRRIKAAERWSRKASRPPSSTRGL